MIFAKRSINLAKFRLANLKFHTRFLRYVKFKNINLQNRRKSQTSLGGWNIKNVKFGLFCFNKVLSRRLLKLKWNLPAGIALNLSSKYVCKFDRKSPSCSQILPKTVNLKR